MSPGIAEELLRASAALRGDIPTSLSASATVASDSAGAMPMRNGARAACTPGARGGGCAAAAADADADAGSTGDRPPTDAATEAAGGRAVEEEEVRERPM